MSHLLTSWKEIANHLGKGVRTVQRWETELGLPVRRPDRDRHIVVATVEELDDWMQRTTTSRVHPELESMRSRIRELEAENQLLRDRLASSDSLPAKVSQTIG